MLDRYAAWLSEVLLPAVGQRVPIADGSRVVGLDGCSLGGHVALEVFLRRPDMWRTIGSVQGAFGIAQARGYAERLRDAFGRVGTRPVHLETSSGDPYRASNQALSRRLTELGVAHELRMAPGPHDQPWLREVGSIEMLSWHERELGR